MALIPNFNRLDIVPEIEQHDEWHSVNTIQLGELYKSGFYNPEDDSWKWDSYSDEQYTRVCKKFLNRYFFYEIGIIPPLNWKMEYLRKMNEIMPKYKLLYEVIDSGEIKILSDSNEYGKSRDMHSDFPQTQLAGNEDYASYGHDREYEKIVNGNVLDKIEKFNAYEDVDVKILNDLEYLFSSLLVVSVNGI